MVFFPSSSLFYPIIYGCVIFLPFIPTNSFHLPSPHPCCGRGAAGFSGGSSARRIWLRSRGKTRCTAPSLGSARSGVSRSLLVPSPVPPRSPPLAVLRAARGRADGALPCWRRSFPAAEGRWSGTCPWSPAGPAASGKRGGTGESRGEGAEGLPWGTGGTGGACAMGHVGDTGGTRGIWEKEAPAGGTDEGAGR